MPFWKLVLLKTEEKDFHSPFFVLPRNLREEIWNYLEERELFQKRLFCKECKYQIENPRTKSLREKIDLCTEKRLTFEEEIRFFKDTTFTKIVLSLKEDGDIGLIWFYGKVTLKFLFFLPNLWFPFSGKFHHSIRFSKLVLLLHVLQKTKV